MIITINQNTKTEDLDKLINKLETADLLVRRQSHPDKILSSLCRSFINRNLLKVKYSSTPIPDELILEKQQIVANYLSITREQTRYFV